MTTLRQTIQTAPARADELITRLAGTSNQALKTRESLLQALTEELILYVELEEKHLLPLLRKRPQTKEIAADAAKGNRELRARLSELAGLPRDDEAFILKVTELKKGFQQHVRDERQELLPAVLEVLDDGEADEVAGRIQDGVADAENARRKESEAAERKADRAAQQATAAAAREMIDTVTAGAVSAQENVREAAATMAERTRETAASVAEAAGVYRGTARRTVRGMATFAVSSSAATRAASEIGSIWLDWLGKAVRTNMDATQRLLGCRDLTQVAETHRAFVTSVMGNGMERNRKLFDAAQRSSRDALRPLDERLAEDA